jgi:hypothetical protein
MMYTGGSFQKPSFRRTGSGTIKGPGLKISLDVRRQWQCPACDYRAKMPGNRVAERCPHCTDVVWLQLVEKQRVWKEFTVPHATDIEIDLDDEEEIAESPAETTAQTAVSDEPPGEAPAAEPTTSETAISEPKTVEQPSSKPATPESIETVEPVVEVEVVTEKITVEVVEKAQSETDVKSASPADASDETVKPRKKRSRRRRRRKGNSPPEGATQPTAESESAPPQEQSQTKQTPPPETPTATEPPKPSQPDAAQPDTSQEEGFGSGVF